MKPRITALAARLATLARQAIQAGPLARRREGAARAAIGMPARYPERITRELPAAQEEWLAAVCAELWPADEYTHIIADTRREDR